jgi:hypothetical protein
VAALSSRAFAGVSEKDGLNFLDGTDRGSPFTRSAISSFMRREWVSLHVHKVALIYLVEPCFEES